MHLLPTARQAEVAQLCLHMGVRRLEVFGSATREDFDETRSDIDLIVEFNDDPERPILKSFFGLKDALEQVLGRPVDLVSSGAIKNRFVRASIDADRQVLYET
jgi:predicted nucleotidyltransferase